MNPIELQRALKQLRLGGIAAVLETRLHQAQTERMAPIDLLSCLVSDELRRRSDRLLERRKKEAEFRDPQVSLENFDFNFNKKMNRSLVFDLATAHKRQSVLLERCRLQLTFERSSHRFRVVLPLAPESRLTHPSYWDRTRAILDVFVPIEHDVPATCFRRLFAFLID